MSDSISFRVIDSAGNITIMVTTPVDPADYQRISDLVLAQRQYGGEQVAFVVDRDTICMAGHEFCGNASRSFALYKALKEHLPGGMRTVTVNVSGVSHPLDVEVDTDRMYTRIRMPDPVSIDELTGCPLAEANGSPVVIMDGIIHVICRGLDATQENFDIINDHIKELYDPAAMGVMFVTGDGDEDNISMIPVVHVFDVDTTFFEGSCGSGATALCAVMSLNKGPGTHCFNIRQPAGSILATGTISSVAGESAASPSGGADCDDISGITIEGPVSISEEITIPL